MSRRRHPSARAADETTLTVRVPVTFNRRGGRKVIVSPVTAGAASDTGRSGPNSALVTAIARAWRWQKMLESGAYSTIAELAAAEKINASLVSRTLRVNLLAPQLVEAALDGTHSDLLAGVFELPSVPLSWAAQQGR